ncbi:hypothetical protein HGRIS_002230 [Hohenbuehelia grisea]|uniref:DBF4-type domain-containing protein n=1 Tax=Hohenbuehelia grisea TaxID=104357 RepID=A0ABR3JKK6_9AGAR
MATLARRPLATRTALLPQCLSPMKQTRTVSGSKRERSPDPSNDLAPKTLKRVKATTTTLGNQEEDRERKRVEREQARLEFKEKYSKAFPKFKFYFDTDTIESASLLALRDDLEFKILRLGGSIEDFFSKEITHFITNRPVSNPSDDKENAQAKSTRPNAFLRSPVKLKGRAMDEHAGEPSYDLQAKAQKFGQKIWTMMKLESVVDRCLSVDGYISKEPAPSNTSNPQRSLSRLLASEKLNGTSERDPLQKRHDFHYFSRGSYFLLVEDLQQDLATIAAHEYEIPKGRNSQAKPPWPVLHCHPLARGPFIEFDEKERRRWERLRRADADKAKAKEDRRARAIRAQMLRPRPEAHLQATNAGDLRRCASMNNIRRRASLPYDAMGNPNCVDLDADEYDNESACASGYLASGNTAGYMAASGNSVGITSTTGTTSTSGLTLDSIRMPAALRGRQQVTTSRRFSVGGDGKSAMGPPEAIPKRAAMLRKSRSTNTMRLPKREEGVKPGYCESCRVKFEDFKHHIRTNRHRKFAANEDNFVQLDYVLERVKRRSLEDVEQERLEREARRRQRDFESSQATSPVSEYSILQYPQTDEDASAEVQSDTMRVDDSGASEVVYVDLDD